MWRDGERTVVLCPPAGASVSARTRSRSGRLFLLLPPGKRRASSGPARSGPARGGGDSGLAAATEPAFGRGVGLGPKAGVQASALAQAQPGDL